MCISDVQVGCCHFIGINSYKQENAFPKDISVLYSWVTKNKVCIWGAVKPKPLEGVSWWKESMTICYMMSYLLSDIGNAHVWWPKIKTASRLLDFTLSHGCKFIRGKVIKTVEVLLKTQNEHVPSDKHYSFLQVSLSTYSWDMGQNMPTTYVELNFFTLRWTLGRS